MASQKVPTSIVSTFCEFIDFLIPETMIFFVQRGRYKETRIMNIGLIFSEEKQCLIIRMPDCQD